MPVPRFGITPCELPAPIVANEKGTREGAFLTVWIRFRTFGRRVMSCNPISCTLAHRATRLGVAWRYLILKSLV
jgi:hypothetical protein